MPSISSKARFCFSVDVVVISKVALCSVLPEVLQVFLVIVASSSIRVLKLCVGDRGANNVDAIQGGLCRDVRSEAGLSVIVKAKCFAILL